MPRGPQAIGTVLADLMARSGFARVQSAAALESAWRQASGPSAARFTRVGCCGGGSWKSWWPIRRSFRSLAFRRWPSWRPYGGRSPTSKSATCGSASAQSCKEGKREES